jgi:S1-C subfamily serine protease
VQVGDVLLAIDGAPVTSAEQALRQIDALPPGAIVSLRLARDGRLLDVSLTITAEPQ